MVDHARLELPHETVELGRLAYAALPTDPDSARLLSEQQLAKIKAAESEIRRTLHKGQPLHNLGIVAYPHDPEAAREFLHAAHIEDLRTYGDNALAADVLVSGMGERPGALRDLADFVAGNDDDPQALARRFADEYGPFGEYRNLLSGARQEGELDAFDRTQLVFVAGSYSVVPHHVTAIATGVEAGGLMPVVVGEFEDATDDNDLVRAIATKASDGLYLLEGLSIRAPDLAPAYRLEITEPDEIGRSSVWTFDEGILQQLEPTDALGNDACVQVA